MYAWSNCSAFAETVIMQEYLRKWHACLNSFRHAYDFSVLCHGDDHDLTKVSAVMSPLVSVSLTSMALQSMKSKYEDCFRKSKHHFDHLVKYKKLLPPGKQAAMVDNEHAFALVKSKVPSLPRLRTTNIQLVKANCMASPSPTGSQRMSVDEIVSREQDADADPYGMHSMSGNPAPAPRHHPTPPRGMPLSARYGRRAKGRRGRKGRSGAQTHRVMREDSLDAILEPRYHHDPNRCKFT